MRPEDVLQYAETFALNSAVTEHQRRLLQTALVGLRQQALEGELAQFVHLPLLIYAALEGDEQAARPLAAATSLLFLGLDIFDDIADGDLPTHWANYRTSEINLAAATLLAAIPQLIIAELDAPPERLAAMQRTLAEGLLRMSAGQQRDLATAGSERVSVAEIEASVEMKTGEEVAMFARLAAQLAGASVETANIYAAMGRALGTGGQLSSDCYDIFTAAHSKDLANGTRTLPIALHLERQNGAERGVFLAMLDKARYDAAAQEEVRERLRAAGEMRCSAFVVETYCQRALRLLDQANPHEAARGELRALINSVSFFTKGDER